MSETETKTTPGVDMKGLAGDPGQERLNLDRETTGIEVKNLNL
jgi:hypothetical protein